MTTTRKARHLVIVADVDDDLSAEKQLASFNEFVDVLSSLIAGWTPYDVYVGELVDHEDETPGEDSTTPEGS